MITDPQYVEFLEVLASDQRSANPSILTEWEHSFIGTYMGVGRHFFFTDARRSSIDKMWRRYGPDLNFPHPLDAVNERPKIAEADPDGCQYLVAAEDGARGCRQQRCNETATCREPGRLRYCQAHGEAVQQAMKRAGRSVALIPFVPNEEAGMKNEETKRL